MTMEERHIPTDHLNERIAPVVSADDCPAQHNQATDMSQRLLDAQTHEMLRSLEGRFDAENKRFRGICFEKGNAVFTDTPVLPPDYKRQLDLCAASYERPSQHPMYKTSNAQYGLQPLLAHTPIEFHARDQEFTSRQSLGGMYEDCHLTTEMDKEIV